MTSWLDITAPLDDQLPHWPGSAGFRRATKERQEDGDRVIDSTITLDVHCGTHIDAPAHYRAAGLTVDHTPLDAMIGKADVIHVLDPVVTADVLERHAPADAERLLLRTSNGSRWPHAPSFKRDFVGLDESAAQWCVNRDLRLVGIDYLSIQSRRASAQTHRILLDQGIVVLEGLDLREATAGRYELLSLPMSISGAEGAPVRALLRTTE